MDELCSIREVALYLDVSARVARLWVEQANIERKTKFAGRDVICITYRDVMRLAELHRCEIVPKPSSLTVREEIKDNLKKLAAEIEDIKHDFRLYVKRSVYIG